MKIPNCRPLTLLATALCAVPASTALAAVEFGGTVTVGSQYDSNALQLNSSASPPPAADGSSTPRDDVTATVGATLTARTGDQGPLRGQLLAGFTHFESLRQKTLSREDYRVGADADWKASEAFDVSLRGTVDRTPLSLADIGGVRAAAQTTSTVQSTFRVRPTPQWQLSLTPARSETRSDLPAAPDFRLVENGGEVAVGFIGAGPLVPGVVVREKKGRYSGIVNPTRYDEKTAGFTLDYKLTDVTNLAAYFGKSRRNTELIDASTDPQALALQGERSGVSYSLALRRTLSVKTSVDLQVFRRFEPYAAGVNTSIGTGFRAGANWAPTPRISTTLDLAQTWSSIDDYLVGGVLVTRKDVMRTISTGANYRATPLLTIEARLTRNVRSSDVPTVEYNNFLVNLGFTVRLH